jgi:hypothetical protein
VLKDRTPAEIKNGLYVHHVLMNAVGRLPVLPPVGMACGPLKSDGVCADKKPASILSRLMPKVSLFIGNGADGGEQLYTAPDRSVESGFYVSAKDKMTAMAEVINYDKYPKEVYFQLDYEYLPGRPKDLHEVGWSVVDVSGCMDISLSKLQMLDTFWERLKA